MNKIMPIAAIAIILGVVAAIALLSNPSASYANMSCDELRNEMNALMLVMPENSQSAKEYLEKGRAIHSLQTEKGCEYDSINFNDITDNFAENFLNSEPTQEPTQSTVQESVNEPGSWISLNSDSYSAGDVIEATVMFNKDLFAEFDDQGPDSESVIMGVQKDGGELRVRTGYSTTEAIFDSCYTAKHYDDDGPNAEWTSYIHESRRASDESSSLCVANEDGSFSYMFTVSDDAPIGDGYTIYAKHGMDTRTITDKPDGYSLSWDYIAREEVYSQEFAIVPNQ